MQALERGEEQKREANYIIWHANSKFQKYEKLMIKRVKMIIIYIKCVKAIDQSDHVTKLYIYSFM